MSIDRLASSIILDKVRNLSTVDSSRVRVRAVNFNIPKDLDTVLVRLHRISLSLEEIRFNKQVELSGLGVISDDVKIVGKGDDVLKIVEFLMGN